MTVGSNAGRASLLRHLPWLCGLVAFAIAAKKLLGGYGDLGIYLDVAREFQEGGWDLCRAREASGPWVYPPCAALPFVVLESVFGDDGARLVWCGLLGVATALLIRALVQIAEPLGGLKAWQWLAFGLLFQRCLAQNLTHGQLSLWVGTLVTMGSASLVQNRPHRAGLLLGIAAACKLTPLLFLPALPWMRQSRAALMMAVTILVAVFVLPIPFCGMDEHLRHLGDFWATTKQALFAPDDAVITTYRNGPSVAGTLNYLLQDNAVNESGYTVHVVNLSDRALGWVRLLWSAVLAGLLLGWFLVVRKSGDQRRLIEQCAAIALGMAFFAPLVRVYHLAAALVPALLFCRGPSRRGTRNRRRDLLWIGTSLALLFTMTLRQRKLIGEDLWRYLDLSGILHFTLVAMMIWVIRQAVLDQRAIEKESDGDASTSASALHAPSRPSLRKTEARDRDASA